MHLHFALPFICSLMAIAAMPPIAISAAETKSSNARQSNAPKHPFVIVIKRADGSARIHSDYNCTCPSCNSTDHRYRGELKTDGITVKWEFVGQSDYGDVYVFSLSAADKKKKPMPIVLSGNESCSIRSAGIEIAIEPPINT